MLGLDGRRDRGAYKVLEEGKPPDFVLELGLAVDVRAGRYEQGSLVQPDRSEGVLAAGPKGGLMASPPIRGLRLYRRGMYGPLQQLTDAGGVDHYRSIALRV